MKTILKLLKQYSNRHGIDACVRIYDDESGVVTNGHVEKCLLDNDALFNFDSISELKEKLKL